LRHDCANSDSIWRHGVRFEIGQLSGDLFTVGVEARKPLADLRLLRADLVHDRRYCCRHGATIKAAPISFCIAVAALGGVVWTTLDWADSARLKNKDEEIGLLVRQRDEYKDKLGGASPDQAKARIDALEARLKRVEPL